MALKDNYDSETFDRTAYKARRNPVLSRIATEVLGALLVAVVLGLVGVVASIRTLAVDNSYTLKGHVAQMKRVEAFHAQGDQFTKQDADAIASDIDYLDTRTDELANRFHALDRRCSDLNVSIAKLPPPRWQARILSLERELAKLTGLMDK